MTDRSAMLRRGLCVGVGVAVALSLAPQPPRAVAAGLTVATPPATPGFATPVASGIQGNGFEQDLRLDPQRNAVYTSAPQSLSSTISDIWRSLDGGQTFKWIPASVQPAGKPVSCVGGGDSELAVDSGGSLYFNDLTLANFSTARSDDQGTTFGANTSCNGVPDVGVDRQWYATDGNVRSGGFLNLAYDRIAQTNSTPITCPNGSPAGNLRNVLVLAQSPLLAGVQAGVNFGPSQTVTCDEGIMGNNEFYRYKDGARVFVVHDNAAFNSVSMGRCDEVGASVTNPTGYVNCQDKLISSFPGSVTGGSFATMSVDRKGNLYAVWEQAPGARGAITGDTSLRFATSSDEGNTWAVSSLPTPGLLNNVFAWLAAGDAGKVDVAWYGTPQGHQGTAGPDSTTGDWSLFLSQTLDNGATWSAPAVASEHFIHRGTINTVMGGQRGDRTLGDFLQIRAGAQGEANISYADSNNIDEPSTPQAMFVRQNSGPGVFGTPVAGTPALTGNCASDQPPSDATFDSGGVVGPNQPNLDLQRVCMSQPDAGHYKVQMQVADLTSLTPGTGAGGTTLIWQTQWHVPSSSDPNGGALFMVYMESVSGQPPTCWAGQNATTLVGGGVALTYPGSTRLTGAACTYTAAAPGIITITVPTSAVSEPGAIGSTLYTVTGSSQTLPTGNAETPPSFGGIGGQLFNLLDVVPSFDFNPSAPTDVPESPWVPLLLTVGGVGAALTVRRKRRGLAAQ
ncbi:MAG: hypothetical protein JF887_00210 [Candidatus Dormibacteraeota bacterium]|uniref:IPTL-CTERM protein sorting domain-containing protein n=1 Tax=Candidatus Amunia macphersoniae TaxID=3127014 RepID=A0A934KHF3_9BACT|nr:hypothetical protein [Candidatus Dormibacteraeota bacterium]